VLYIKKYIFFLYKIGSLGSFFNKIIKLWVHFGFTKGSSLGSLLALKRSFDNYSVGKFFESNENIGQMTDSLCLIFCRGDI
jgi:hypothetical protein